MVAGLLARCRFPTGRAPVVCAVSGGADSLALLVLARRADLDVTAVHVDHGLRPAGELEAAFVATVAASYGARFEARTVSVGAGPNLEARARAARYAVLGPDVLTGHTADDQAETVLLNLMRGAGLDGLAGIDPDGPVRRPLLALRRAETRALCASQGLTPFEDPTNAAPHHRRNRVRHELLPLLDAIAERDVAAVLARQTELLRAEARLLDELAAGIDPTDAPALAGAPAALARRAIRRWLTPFLGGFPPSAAVVERVRLVADGTHRACQLPGGGRVQRHRQRLSLVAPRPSR